MIPGWEIGEPTLEVFDNRYDSNFGDPRVEDITYSRAIFDLPVTRPKGTYALKLLLPMLLVALTAALALLVHPRYVEGRIGIGITALLTLVALQITSNSSLPEVDYLILLDKIYIASYAFVVLTMVMIVRNSWVDAEGDVAVAKRVDRRSLLVADGRLRSRRHVHLHPVPGLSRRGGLMRCGPRGATTLGGNGPRAPASRSAP